MIFFLRENTLCCILVPQIDVFDVKQPEVLQGERFQVVPGHAQLLHGGQPLQHLGHVVELVEGKAHITESLQRAQLGGQVAQAVSV